jgi:hypothetical protein
MTYFYLSMAGALTIYLFFLWVSDPGIDYKEFIKMYRELEDFEKEKMDHALRRFFEKFEIEKDRKRNRLIKAISSNQWLRVAYLYGANKWVLTEEERTKFKRQVLKKFPHLRGRVERERWPFN